MGHESRRSTSGKMQYMHQLSNLYQIRRPNFKRKKGPSKKFRISCIVEPEPCHNCSRQESEA